MNTIQVLRGGLLAGLFAWLVAASAMAAGSIAEETLAPAQITIGESADLTIRNSVADAPPPTLPLVAGLKFRVVEQLHGVQLVHGATIVTTTTVVRVTPQVAGTFFIPATGARSQPLMLRVNPVKVGGSSPATHTGMAHETAAGGIRMTEDDSAFIKLEVQRREVYVGESVPIAIEVGLRAGVVTSVNGLPSLEGTDFTLNDLSRKPDRRETVIDGEPFVLLTWHSALAPVKQGEFSLIVDMPLTVRLSTRPKAEAQLEDRLGDPFMQRLFGATVRKDLKAVSPPLDLSVSALPTEGRPPEFSGAVGAFKISSDVSSAAAAAGDPLTLRLHVTGTGNFDRVDSPMLAHAGHWKTYPPTSSFKSSDELGLKGEKIFEQPVVASDAGTQVLPAMTFAYFDPETRRYEMVRTSPIDVAISPSAADSALTAREVAAAGSLSAARSAKGLRPDHTASGAVASSLVPPYLRTPFLAASSVMAFLCAGAWFRLRARSDARAEPRQGELSKSTRRALAEMEEAVRDGDGTRFFSLARRTLQETLAARWRMAPGSITAAELEVRLGADGGGDAGVGEELRRLFARADEVNYAGQGLDRAELARWIDFVRRQALGEAP